MLRSTHLPMGSLMLTLSPKFCASQFNPYLVSTAPGSFFSTCQGPPALLGWATGNLPEPKNNPQVGMANMRTIMPALQKAKPGSLLQNVRYLNVSPPKQQRQTRVVKDRSTDEIAAELAEWIKQE